MFLEHQAGLTRGVIVTDDTTSGINPLLSRRNFLRAGVLGAAGAGVVMYAGRQAPNAVAAPGFTPTKSVDVHLAATDGWVSMPDSAPADPPYWPDPYAPAPYNMYVFGFRNVTGLSDAQVIGQKGRAQISAPVLAFDEGSEVKVGLTNLGLAQRPDLIDGHTLHWHGFNNAIPIFDGVPEMSAAVPIGKTMIYYYRPTDPGTYMYHCHFEDVEHVQMGMTGLVYIRPKMNNGANRYVFNDPATRYDREFPIFLTENMPEGHYRDAHIQITDWAAYNSGFGLMNGRAWPDTIVTNPQTTDSALGQNFDPLATYPAGSQGERLQFQPQTSLIHVNAGETVLLRIASLGSLVHTLTLDGVSMKVIGSDALQLKGADGTDNSYVTNSIDCGPGESRDVLFTAPDPGVYKLYDRDFYNLSNQGSGGYGGMMTNIVVEPPGTLPAQPLQPFTPGVR
jgi:FtsP/CotA-like multicopper oxidase with cupredoxin domain